MSAEKGEKAMSKPCDCPLCRDIEYQCPYEAIGTVSWKGELFRVCYLCGKDIEFANEVERTFKECAQGIEENLNEKNS